MINLQYTLSVEKNTNKLISSSKDKFLGIVAGNLIKIDNDPVIHTIIGRDSFLYIKDFTIQDSKIIIIDEEINTLLQKEDVLKFSYKEYEAKFISKIINSGQNYIPNEIVSTKGGKLSIDIYSSSSQPTILEITQLGENRCVTSIEINNPGKYIESPQNPIEVYSKTGEQLLLEIKYMETSNRTIIERTIKDIHISNGKTYITLDYSIPPNVTNGKISCEKNILLLSSNYAGETKRNIKYEVFVHFTPNIKLPLLVKNSLSSEAILNKALLLIDEEIGKIKQKIN